VGGVSEQPDRQMMVGVLSGSCQALLS